MGIDTHKLLQDAITLFVVINPFGAIPHYLTLTRGMQKRERLRVARRGCTYAAVVLLVFIAIGELALDGLHVHLDSFRVAGGLLLLLISIKTVLATSTTHPLAESAGGEKVDVAIFPLAMPFLAGPGSIIAAVLLTEDDMFSLVEQAVTSAIALGLLLLTYAILASADVLQRHLGSTGTSIMSRIFGLVLAALAMQTMLDGLRPYFKSLVG